MTNLKIKDWAEGTYTKVTHAPETETRKHEIDILEKIKGNLPPNTFLVSASVEIVYRIQVTAEEIKDSFQSWSKEYRYTIPVVKKEHVEVTTKDLETTITTEMMEKAKTMEKAIMYQIQKYSTDKSNE
jgi:hypothetical protein